MEEKQVARERSVGSRRSGRFGSTKTSVRKVGLVSRGARRRRRWTKDEHALSFTSSSILYVPSCSRSSHNNRRQRQGHSRSTTWVSSSLVLGVRRRLNQTLPPARSSSRKQALLSRRSIHPGSKQQRQQHNSNSSKHLRHGLAHQAQRQRRAAVASLRLRRLTRSTFRAT